MLKPTLFIEDIDIFTKESDIAVVIRVKESRLDINNYHKIRKQVEALVDCNFNLIIIDLQNCDVMTDDGFSGLVTCYKEAMNHRCRIALCSLQPQVKELLRLTRMNKVYEVYDHLEDVLKKYLVTRGEQKTDVQNNISVKKSQKYHIEWKVIASIFIAFVTALVVYVEFGQDLSAVLLSTPITFPCIFYAIKIIGKNV